MFVKIFKFDSKPERFNLIKKNLEIKYINVAHSIASVLSMESANILHEICVRYNIGDGIGYSSPRSKEKYYKNLLVTKDEQFILKLAKRVMEDYQSDQLALVLNQYYDGTFFKLSVVTRKELLSELYKLGALEGNLSKEEFLKNVNLQHRIPFAGFDIFSSAFGTPNNNQEKKPIDLNQILRESNIHEVRDERFFHLLELIVHPYTRSNEQSGPYLAMINAYLQKDSLCLLTAGDISGQMVFKVGTVSGVHEPVKNLIFASNRYKPEIILEDALSNRIKIVRNGEYTLVYDKPIKSSGLLWVDLVKWWAELQGEAISKEQAQLLKIRLFNSLASEPEKVLFECYYKTMPGKMQRNLPALVPQVYLHYDPYSIKQYGIQYLLRQRMDFLLLLPGSKRIVIEVDGIQHYSESTIAKPSKYAEMVALDRDLKLLGYEVYRFGGYELVAGNESMLVDFFEKLFKKHQLL